MSVRSTYREFGSLDVPEFRFLPEGLSLADMAEAMPLPPDFGARGVICLNGRPVPRGAWARVRPKAMANGVQVEITFHAVPMGGGNEGGKSILAIVAGIALTALTGFVASGGLATRFGLTAFKAGSIAATLAAAGVSLAGSLLISALVPPPTFDSRNKTRSVVNPGAASADGNVLDPNASVPRVLGTRKVYPPLAAEPYVYFDGPDEVVEAIYVLAGPHQLTDIRVGTAPAAGITDLEYETRPGFPGDARLTLVSRQSRTEQVQSEIRGHTVAASDGLTLESVTGETASALPQRVTVATREAPDFHELQLLWSGGLHKNASGTEKLRVPFRLRIRPVGDGTWTDLPELHFQAASVRQLRATIRLVWTSGATVSPGAASNEGWVEARVAAPAQTLSPAVAAWNANPYFDTGPGTDDWLAAGNAGTTGVSNVILDRYTAAIYLDAAIFPKGRYEVEIRRGAQFLTANYVAAAYTINGAVRDPYSYTGTPGQIPQTRDGVQDSVYLLRSVSVWNEHPLPTDDFAVIALRARNRQVDKVSCLAGGWVRDWDGTGWRAWTVTANPAPHLRDIYTGDENLDPVPAVNIDEAELVAWRSDCTAKNYRVNALIEDSSVEEAARIVAACGYARPYMSEVYGVTRDYDRSAEVPVQIFTARNSAGFKWQKAFARLPDGFRVNFRDAARDYDSRQITVFRAGVSDDTGLLEQVTYEGLVTEAEVRARAIYDLAQAEARAAFYSVEAPAEAIICRRGSLVGVVSDAIEELAGAGRIIDWMLNGSGQLISVKLDSKVSVVNEPDLRAVTDLRTVADMRLVGRQTGAVIRRQGSRSIHALANATGASDTLTLATPASAAGIVTGLLVATGPLASEMLRLIVFGVAPKDELAASLTFVDEAPGLVPTL